MINEAVVKTKSGLIVRFDSSIGLFVYSPYTGLVFAVHKDYAKQTVAWLNKKLDNKIDKQIRSALGIGWDNSPIDEYPRSHLLPNAKSFSTILRPKYPILINWLITGMCPLACKYCYAEDLMRIPANEPQERHIRTIVESILSYNPLVVVLTGGDPLVSKYLLKAIQLLHKRTGIIVDTSAYNFDNKYLSIFKKFNVTVRISLDSEIPSVNDKQRLLSKQTYLQPGRVSILSAAVKAICVCLKKGITVSVQTVATKETANDLPVLGDKLYRLGLHSWRILKIQPSEKSLAGYEELIGSKEKQKKLYKHIFSELKKAQNSKWKNRMSLQIIQNESPNAVILVSPVGKFYTESNIHPEKLLLDEKNPTRPNLKKIFDKVNIYDHVKRYLNLE